MPDGSILKVLSIGCGVTAYDLQDALAIIREKLFQCQELPPITEIIEDVDVSKLDKGHVLPNITKPPSNYGIWFPYGF